MVEPLSHSRLKYAGSRSPMGWSHLAIARARARPLAAISLAARRLEPLLSRSSPSKRCAQVSMRGPRAVPDHAPEVRIIMGETQRRVPAGSAPATSAPVPHWAGAAAPLPLTADRTLQPRVVILAGARSVLEVQAIILT